MYTTDKEQLQWLAGLLEGEGCFTVGRQYRSEYRFVTVQLNMCDFDVVRKARDVIGAGTLTILTAKRKPNHSPTLCLKVGGKNAISLMVALLPHMGLRRTARIKELLEINAVERARGHEVRSKLMKVRNDAIGYEERVRRSKKRVATIAARKVAGRG